MPVPGEPQRGLVTRETKWLEGWDFQPHLPTSRRGGDGAGG